MNGRIQTDHDDNRGVNGRIQIADGRIQIDHDDNRGANGRIQTDHDDNRGVNGLIQIADGRIQIDHDDNRGTNRRIQTDHDDNRGVNECVVGRIERVVGRIERVVGRIERVVGRIAQEMRGKRNERLGFFGAVGQIGLDDGGEGGEMSVSAWCLACKALRGEEDVGRKELACTKITYSGELKLGEKTLESKIILWLSKDVRGCGIVAWTGEREPGELLGYGSEGSLDWARSPRM